MTNGKASVSWISNKAELRIAMQDNGEDARFQIRKKRKLRLNPERLVTL